MELAMERYCRTASRQAGGIYEQPGMQSIIEHDGVRYVVLTNHYRTLAVYRIGSCDKLQRLHKWPAEVSWNDC